MEQKSTVMTKADNRAWLNGIRFERPQVVAPQVWAPHILVPAPYD